MSSLMFLTLYKVMDTHKPKRTKNMTLKKLIDMHRVGSVQLKIWLPEELRTSFAAVCTETGDTTSRTLRHLMQAYIKQSLSTKTQHV